MPAKWIDLYESYCDASDFKVRIKKFKGKYIVQFIQMAGDFEHPSYYAEDGWYFLSNCERLLFEDEVTNGKGFVKAFEEAKKLDEICYNETPPIQDILTIMQGYNHLKILHNQVKKVL